MNDDEVAVSPVVEELRRAFDDSFALPPPELRAEGRQALLIVRLSLGHYALRVAELCAVAKLGAVTALPSRVPGLLGLTGFRGGAVPVYAMAALLGQTSGARTAAWMAIAGKDEPVAIAFDAIERYVDVNASAFRSVDGSGPTDHIRQAVGWAGGTALVLEMNPTLAAIRGRVQMATARER
jgi:purine-binding chemotaxis protein CheW